MGSEMCIRDRKYSEDFFADFEVEAIVVDKPIVLENICLLYTSDAADDMQCVDLGGRRIIKK